MTKNEHFPEFNLFGGPLQRLGRRMGLVRGKNTFWLGAALGLLAWGVLVALAILVGGGHRLFALKMIGVHTRFLVAVPLFFLCETWVGPRMAEFVRGLVRSGIVPGSERVSLEAAIRRVDRLKDPWPAEMVFFVLAFAAPIAQAFADVMPGRTADLAALLVQSEGRIGPVLVWYLGFCLPMFRFLFFRWAWHFGLWCYFLWRVQRLDLRLIPAHPDRAGGLGYLEVVQEHFGVLAFAISAFFSGSFAENITAGTMAFEALYLLIPFLLVATAALFLVPFFIFSPKLWACRVSGWSEYMDMASRYVGAFDRKWIHGANPAGESILGTPDMQSLADLGNSVSVVREMQWIPGSRRFLLGLAVAVVAPMLPLLLLKYPVMELAALMFKTLTGL